MRGNIMLALCAAAAGPAAAQTVYPSSATVPENVLRVSIAFGAPQSTGLPAVRLTTPDGKDIEGAFYPQPLWSPDGRTLTLYLDPGRVKTGLALRDSMKAILTVGMRVELRLGRKRLKHWTVVPAQKRAIAPQLDAARPPRKGSRERIDVVFSSPIDWQGRNMIAIAAPDGTRVAGTGRLFDGEKRWQFSPAQPWLGGTYTVRLHPDLEDPEGNRVAARFEIKDTPRTTLAPEWLQSFSVR